MDPDANLKEQREVVAAMLQYIDSTDDTGETVEPWKMTAWGERLAELVQALDEWISQGGFLPAAWRQDARERPDVR